MLKWRKLILKTLPDAISSDFPTNWQYPVTYCYQCLSGSTSATLLTWWQKRRSIKKGGLVGADILLIHVHMKVEQSPNDYLVPVMNVLRYEVALRDTVRKMENYLAGRPSSDSSGTQQSTSEAAMGKA